MSHPVKFTRLQPLVQNGALEELVDVVANHKPTERCTGACSFRVFAYETLAAVFGLYEYEILAGPIRRDIASSLDMMLAARFFGRARTHMMSML